MQGKLCECGCHVNHEQLRPYAPLEQDYSKLKDATHKGDFLSLFTRQSGGQSSTKATQ